MYVYCSILYILHCFSNINRLYFREITKNGVLIFNLSTINTFLKVFTINYNIKIGIIKLILGIRNY
jgi:hypothetical protein